MLSHIILLKYTLLPPLTLKKLAGGNTDSITYILSVGSNRKPVKKKNFATKKSKGRTRIRTGVGRIKTDSDNHYTIQPFPEKKKVWINIKVYYLAGFISRNVFKVNVFYTSMFQISVIF